MDLLLKPAHQLNSSNHKLLPVWVRREGESLDTIFEIKPSTGRSMCR